MKRLATASETERADVLRIAAENYRLAPALIEKDFWVCWTLGKLFALPNLAPHILFKGGTTLSKVYGVIQRFSEDIDISLSREFIRPGEGEAAEADVISKTRRRKEIDTLVASFYEAVDELVLPELQRAIQTELGPQGKWRLVKDAHDPGTLLCIYPPGITEPHPYNAPSVRIEMEGTPQETT